MFFLLLCTVGVSAQTAAEKLAAIKIKQLNSLGVDTVLTYRLESSLYRSWRDPKLKCSTVDLVFLIWADKKHNFIQQIDPCYEREQVIDEMGEIISLLRNNMPELIKEELKPAMEVGKINGRDTTYEIRTLHDSKYIYTINISDKHYTKALSEYSLNTKEFIDSTKPNINYNFNQATHLKLLNDFITKKLDALHLQLAALKK
jgi:hypothetical protein